jgi:hypothetical protein
MLLLCTVNIYHKPSIDYMILSGTHGYVIIILVYIHANIYYHWRENNIFSSAYHILLICWVGGGVLKTVTVFPS